MFDPATMVAAAFGNHLAETYLQAFPEQKPQYAVFLNKTAHETLQVIGASDAPYHDAEHTMIVTLVGQQIIQGQQKTSRVLPEDWVHYIAALLIHDIGYRRGVCEGDTSNEVIVNDAGERIFPPRGATDASLAPYHVDRGKIYARQRFAGSGIVDPERIAAAIEYTRFPVPDDPAYADLNTEPALVRAADLIGQIADPHYLDKLSALYREFVETDFAAKLGYSSPMDLVEHVPNFFQHKVQPLIGPALEHLRQTADGKEVIAQLERRVSQASRRDIALRPYPGT
ncbi:hypothetical protein [Roseovarius phycicola]|uniref:hypothetical protein n=1 Tax=Roseovarius phycicola TaxID=3080976 RepID=UPI0030CF38B7